MSADPNPGQELGDYTSDEMMTVAAARSLPDGAVCFVGIGLPSAAANLARRTHAPNLVLVYESGTLGAKPENLPLSIGDGELAETADSVVSVLEIFNYWLQGRRINIGFLSAAQLDRYANINTTMVGGTYEHPTVRLPGAGGAPEIATGCDEVIIIVRQNLRTFVSTLDFVTSIGLGHPGVGRKELGLTGKGPVRVITDLGILEPAGPTGVLTLTQLHAGVSVADVKAATGWPLAVAEHVRVVPPPTEQELQALRMLKAR